MSFFKKWLLGLEEAQKSVQTPSVRPKKVKVPVVVHGDIDVWLKAVDGLAQDLQDLKSAKEKAKQKMDDITSKAKAEKSEEKPKTSEKPGQKPEKDQKKPEKLQQKPEKDQQSDKEEKKKSWLHPFKTAASRIGNLIKKWTDIKKTEK